MEKFTQGDDAGAGLDLRGSLPGRERGEACQDMKRIAQNVRSVLGMVRPVWLELRVVAEDEAGGTGWGGGDCDRPRSQA